MEGAAFACVGLFALCVALWLPIALIATTGGLAGLVADRRRKGAAWIVSLCALSVGACMLFVFVRNKFFPEHPPRPSYHIMDEQLKPFVPAMNEVDPPSLGFTPIPANAQITIYEDEDTPKCHVELFVYIGPRTSDGQYAYQTICFQKVDDTYKWIGELEYHESRNEWIVMRYGTVPRDRYPTAHTLIIEYTGKDPRLQKPNLTLEDIRPILAEWEERRLTPRPSQ